VTPVRREAVVDESVRLEVLPLGSSEEQAARLPEPVRLTITCSPKHGPDRSVEVAARMRGMGHSVTVHLAARMVRDRDHLETLLGRIADAAIDDLFVVGGDTPRPVGPYASAAELLPLIGDRGGPSPRIGIAGYPEGHPLIDERELDDALERKCDRADYISTQLCLDPDALRGWIRRTRSRGIDLPVFMGIPGQLSRRRLVEMSVRVGVGPSLSFLRKQRGLRRLLGRSAADRLYDALAPSLGDPDLNIAGFQCFTFNELAGTWEWLEQKRGARPPAEAIGR
jgi:methylenetetrahydrofolate reductase (NADPH)